MALGLREPELWAGGTSDFCKFVPRSACGLAVVCGMIWFCDDVVVGEGVELVVLVKSVDVAAGNWVASCDVRWSW